MKVYYESLSAYSSIGCSTTDCELYVYHSHPKKMTKEAIAGAGGQKAMVTKVESCLEKQRKCFDTFDGVINEKLVKRLKVQIKEDEKLLRKLIKSH